MHTRYRSAFVGLVLIASGSPPVSAGGLYLNEFATPSMGTAGAGAEAFANDASTSFAMHNPAGMTRLEGHSISLGAGVLYGDNEFESDPNTPFSGGDGGNQGGFAPIVGTHGVYSISDDLKFGVSLFTISGAALDPDDSWTGRYQLTEIELLTVTANPNVAYRVNKWLSLAAGINIMYADIDYKLAAPPIMPPTGGRGSVEIDGDDFAFGYNLGVLLEPSPRTRIGVIYISEVEPEFEGDLQVFARGGAGFSVASNLEFTFPNLVRVGAYHELNDKWALLGTVGWEEWSAFDELLVSTERGGVSIPTNWDDTYHFSGGVHYKATDTLLLQAGVTYDTSPVGASDRTAELPLDRQIRVAFGAQYKLNERTSVGGAFEYIDLGDSRIDNPNVLVGEYPDDRIYVFALNLSHKF